MLSRWDRGGPRATPARAAYRNVALSKPISVKRPAHPAGCGPSGAAADGRAIAASPPIENAVPARGGLSAPVVAPPRCNLAQSPGVICKSRGAPRAYVYAAARNLPLARHQRLVMFAWLTDGEACARLRICSARRHSGERLGEGPVKGEGEVMSSRAALARGARAAASVVLSIALAACAAAPADVRTEQPPDPAALRAQAIADAKAQRQRDAALVRPDWRAHFDDISKGAILVNIDRKWLVYWEPGGQRSHAFPIATPMSDDLERTGRTKVVRRRADPDWRATPSMIERNPDVPRYIGPGPDNPLGQHALYLGWRYYAIHGTNTPGVIGDRVTSGCFRLFNEDIAWLFDNVAIGAPVLVVDDVEVKPASKDQIGVSGRPSRSLPPEAPPAPAPGQRPWETAPEPSAAAAPPSVPG